MNVSHDSNDTIKFWTFLTVMLLAVAVAVTLIDLTIKASILAESNAMKLAMEDWEVRHGQENIRRPDKRNHPDPANNGHLSGDVLATGNAGLEARDAIDRIADAIPPRSRPRNKPPTPRRDREIPDGN